MDKALEAIFSRSIMHGGNPVLAWTAMHSITPIHLSLGLVPGRGLLLRSPPSLPDPLSATPGSLTPAHEPAFAHAGLQRMSPVSPSTFVEPYHDSKPATKYQPLAPSTCPTRRWPSRSITRPPVWLSTDLRDSNQALFGPMNGGRKMKLFQELVRIGFKGRSGGLSAASQTDFDFVRRLIDETWCPTT